MKEKEPKIVSFRNATTIYMGHANGQDGEWDLFYSVHFEDRSAERKCSVEKAGIILGTIFEDAIFADKVSEDIVLSRASRRQSYDYVEKRQRFQILDMVNKVSFILELFELPQQKESHNKTHQQGSIATLFFCVLMKKDYSNSSPSSSASVFRYLNTVLNESGEWSYSVI